MFFPADHKAGGNFDGNGEATSSVLLGVNANGSVMQTTNMPAFWMLPGQCKCDKPGCPRQGCYPMPSDPSCSAAVNTQKVHKSAPWLLVCLFKYFSNFCLSVLLVLVFNRGRSQRTTLASASSLVIAGSSRQSTTWLRLPFPLLGRMSRLKAQQDI